MELFEIILLGTSAATPTLNRSATATAIARSNEILLFDCGEGAQVQFLKAKLKPGKLCKIFISHFHGDHINGLIGLLTSLQLGGRTKPMSLYGPVGLKDYLAYMQNFSGFSFTYPLIINEVDSTSNFTEWHFTHYKIVARPLQHRVFSLGFRLEEKKKPGKFDADKADQMGIPEGQERAALQRGEQIQLADGQSVKPDDVIGPAREGKKVAICADTSPCENALQLAQDTDVLVYEGTFAADFHKKALATGHSTIVQAAKLARQAGTQKLVLIHLSARHDRDDEKQLLMDAQGEFANTIIGRDLMRIVV